MSADLTVLFVDDEPNVLQGIRRITRRQRGQWNMHFIASGEEALRAIEELDVDVIVSDIRMPGMDGTELLRRVKSAGSRGTRARSWRTRRSAGCARIARRDARSFSASGFTSRTNLSTRHRNCRLDTRSRRARGRFTKRR